MEKKKVNFFKRTKDAVANFDEYRVFAEEDLSVTIKYILEFILMFSIILTICLTFFFIQKTNRLRETLYTEIPDFRFENNNLIIEGDNKQFIKTDSNQYFELIINSEKDDLDDIEEMENYQVMCVAFLKDKIVIRNLYNMESVLTYEELNEKIDLSTINKQAVYDATQSNRLILRYITLALTELVFLGIVFLFRYLFDILIISLIAFLFSRIILINLKYKPLFNISAYSLVLSMILYLIYMCVKLFTGFDIKYFNIAYNTISYIYVLTALFLIRSDLIKQKIEVQKIIEIQKEVREELKEKEKEKEEERKRSEDKKQKDNKEKKKQENKNNKNEEPQGNQA